MNPSQNRPEFRYIFCFDIVYIFGLSFKSVALYHPQSTRIIVHTPSLSNLNIIAPITTDTYGHIIPPESIEAICINYAENYESEVRQSGIIGLSMGDR